MANLNYKRTDGRTFNQVRPINLKYDVYGYAPANILFEQGDTKILLSVTLQDGVPQFLRGQKIGWLTAEYSMLPCATEKRTIRDSNQFTKNSRSVEISRLIGRALRSVVDISSIGERTIIIDCDVLQADGSTRVACITAASLALKLACSRWLESGLITKNIFKEFIAGISVGLVEDNYLVDLSYQEDSQANADFNFIISQSGKLIEIQGTAEKSPLFFKDFDIIKNLAIESVNNIFSSCAEKSENIFKTNNINNNKKAPFFSIANRLDKK